MHDLSKLSPSEFFPYMNYFSDEEFIILSNKSEVTELEQREIQRRESEFDKAWLHHQHLNDHHPQFFILREDSGGTKVLQMPDECVREMVADWIGAGIAITGKREVREWYARSKDKMLLHPRTRELVESLLVNI